MWPFTKRQKLEKRSHASGFTTEILSARASYIAGRSGFAELTATAQSCVSLWEGALAMSDVAGASLLDRRSMAIAARGLALRGEAVFLIREMGLVPCSDWDLRTRDARRAPERISRQRFRSRRRAD